MKINAVNLFVNRYMAGAFWLFVTIVSNCFWAYYNLEMTKHLKAENKIAIMDKKGDIILTTGEHFNRSKQLHTMCVENATIALLSKNPKGLDYPRRLDAYFLESAKTQALTDLNFNASELKEKKIHQKVEIGEIITQAGLDSQVFAKVTGQIILNGEFEGQKFIYPKKFKLLLTLRNNPSLGTNDFAPYAVETFDYSVFGETTKKGNK